MAQTMPGVKQALPSSGRNDGSWPKKMPDGSLREFTDGRMEHSAGSVNG